MKKLISCLGVALLAFAGVATAQPGPAPQNCSIEAAPAATLLLPYFEVDIDHADGVDTFFSVNNARNYSVLTHVIVWTDASVEALDFNVYLTGYDVQTIGLGLIIRDGILPRTATSSSVSPRGPYSGPHPSYGSCAGILPYTNPALDAEFLAHLQSILTGGPSAIYGGRCGGADYGDNIARGYVTVDVVNDCTLLTPCDIGYFTVQSDEDYPIVGAYDNAIWGDWYMIDYANNFAQGDTLVHVELVEQVLVEPNAPEGIVFAGPVDWTFWGRCATIAHGDRYAVDFREPLPSTFATRFYQNAAFSGGTDFLVWRDAIFNHAFGDEDGFSCTFGPSWFPLNERQVVFFDEQENPEEVCTISPCPEQDILFPLEAQRVSVGDLDVSPESGWTYMNLNQLWIVNGVPTVIAGQAWVTAVHSAEGRFSAGLSAIQLDSVCDYSSVIIGPSGPDFPYDEGSYSAAYSYYYYYYYYYGGLKTRPGNQDVRNPLD